MQHQIVDLLKDRYPDFQFSKVSGTSHWNVVRMWDPHNERYLVAKAIMDYTNNTMTDANRMAMNDAWEMEASVIASLPSWWGLQMVDSFREGPVRILVTTEIPNKSWMTYKPSHDLDRRIALDLERQLRWLLDAGISHNDLELKNILFTGDRAIIIDFEKATREKGRDVEKIIQSFSEKEHLKGIAKTLLERLGARTGRRASMRKRRRVQKRKSRKV